jgi:enoyl-CoA hydratase/carnithine racemase
MKVSLHRKPDGVAVLQLDRPAHRNALDDEMLENLLPAAVSEAAGDPMIRCLVVTGTGGAFCAGADLQSRAMALDSPADSMAFLRRSHRSMMGLRSMGKPTVAAIDGATVGAGLGLALACDLRFASAGSRFSTPFIKLGLPPDFGTSYLLPRAVGASVALEMFLTARSVDADEALRIGLITGIVDEPLAAACALGAELAQNPPGAMAATRRNVYRNLELDIDAAVIENEINSVAIALHGEEFRRCLGAWREKVMGPATKGKGPPLIR